MARSSGLAAPTRADQPEAEKTGPQQRKRAGLRNLRRVHGQLRRCAIGLHIQNLEGPGRQAVAVGVGGGLRVRLAVNQMAQVVGVEARPIVAVDRAGIDRLGEISLDFKESRQFEPARTHGDVESARIAAISEVGQGAAAAVHEGQDIAFAIIGIARLVQIESALIGERRELAADRSIENRVARIGELRRIVALAGIGIGSLPHGDVVRPADRRRIGRGHAREAHRAAGHSPEQGGPEHPCLLPFVLHPFIPLPVGPKCPGLVREASWRRQCPRSFRKQKSCRQKQLNDFNVIEARPPRRVKFSDIPFEGEVKKTENRRENRLVACPPARRTPPAPQGKPPWSQAAARSQTPARCADEATIVMAVSVGKRSRQQKHTGGHQQHGDAGLENAVGDPVENPQPQPRAREASRNDRDRRERPACVEHPPMPGARAHDRQQRKPADLHDQDIRLEHASLLNLAPAPHAAPDSDRNAGERAQPPDQAAEKSNRGIRQGTRLRQHDRTADQNISPVEQDDHADGDMEFPRAEMQQSINPERQTQ